VYDLFHGVGECLEFGQVDAEDAHEEGHRGAAEGEQGLGHHRNEYVLPVERVQNLPTRSCISTAQRTQQHTTHMCGIWNAYGCGGLHAGGEGVEIGRDEDHPSLHEQ
jgi:hypothetical protein